MGYQPPQPINFSHKLHAGEMDISCLYCHNSVDKGRHATVPSTNTCMNCHKVARSGRPEIVKLADSFRQNKPIYWSRIHKVPDFVYFNHSVHVNKGLDCASCHGNIKEMAVVKQVRSFNMNDCLSCHRNAPQMFPKIKGLKKGPENCFACHR